MVRVKICGITNLPDAKAAWQAGCDALGFVFYRPSPRYVEPEVACHIVRQLPPFLTKVGVFVNSPLAEVREILETCRLDLAQLHGAEDAAFCAALRPKAIKALRVRDGGVLEEMASFPDIALVLDAHQPGQYGGTGQIFDWQLARRAVDRGRTIILSGGLTPANVADAIAAVRPYAVDVASGVEIEPGKKGHAKVRAFVEAAKSASTWDNVPSPFSKKGEG